MIPVKIDVSENSDANIITATTEDGVVAGNLLFEPVNGDIIRMTRIEVLEGYRRGGIATVLIDAITSYLSGEDKKPILTAWYDDDDLKEGLGDFLESTQLFDFSDDVLNGRNVHIAVWNGNTFDEQYIEE